LIGDWERKIARVDHEDPVELQIFESSAHGGCQPRAVYPFAFHTDAATILEQQQIQFGSVMGRPIVGLVRCHNFQYFLNGIPFPGCLALGMGLQVQIGANAEQLMQQSRIVEVNLGGLDLALLEVGMPGLENAHHEHPFQDIQVMSHRRFANPQRARQFGGSSQKVHNAYGSGHQILSRSDGGQASVEASLP